MLAGSLRRAPLQEMHLSGPPRSPQMDAAYRFVDLYVDLGFANILSEQLESKGQWYLTDLSSQNLHSLTAEPE